MPESRDGTEATRKRARLSLELAQAICCTSRDTPVSGAHAHIRNSGEAPRRVTLCLKQPSAPLLV